MFFYVRTFHDQHLRPLQNEYTKVMVSMAMLTGIAYIVMLVSPASRHGIILAKNEPAKAFGIKTAETIWQARKKSVPGWFSFPPTTTSTGSSPAR